MVGQRISDLSSAAHFVSSDKFLGALGFCFPLQMRCCRTMRPSIHGPFR